MSRITHEDFGFFQKEFLQIDFISFNLMKLSHLEISQIGHYFQKLGFNCYLKKYESSVSRQECSNNNYYRNSFELYIILNVL